MFHNNKIIDLKSKYIKVKIKNIGASLNMQLCEACDEIGTQCLKKIREKL